MRQRAMLTPNLLCRMALTASLEMGRLETEADGDSDGQEFNSYTLLGSDQPLYEALLRIVEASDETGADDTQLVGLLKAHIERGVDNLSLRIKSPADAARLLAGDTP